MDGKYIFGLRLRVNDIEGAARWLCENLFFQVEKAGETLWLKNGNARLILKKDESADTEFYGPDDMCLGLRHIALETHDIQAAIAYCKEKGLELQLGDGGNARYSGKVYGTGMDYFNIVSGYGFTIEVSQKLHCSSEVGSTLIAGLEHVGLQVPDAYEAIQFYENLGFKKEFEPVINFVDDHKIICGMVSATGTTVEIYEFNDLKNLPVQKKPIIEALIIGDKNEPSGKAESLWGPAGECLEFQCGYLGIRAAN